MGRSIKRFIGRKTSEVNEELRQVSYKELQTEDEKNNRHLLTVTATFAYKKQLRWVWYYVSITCCILYAGKAPAYFKAYFNCRPYLDLVVGNSEDKNKNYQQTY